ncbi:MAG: hypothetical protein ACK4L7_02290 [Flavobacteriales bacterium]
MLSTIFGKKRISEEKLANVFVNTVLEMCSAGFPMVAAELNEAPEFESSPGIGEDDDLRFLLIVLTANLMEMDRAMGPGTDKRLHALSVSKFAQAVGMGCSEADEAVRGLRDRMARLNYPSKNWVYAMGRAMFLEYDLFRFQDEYFRGMRSPNPIILKRLNGLFAYLMFDWEGVKEQYKVG